ncbi:MAG TPA: acyl-CoA dehydrogenase family protein [Thermomicrobiales bacterium]|nr:acyl-CoA dehydrogenase family protein [Thermomicrobiales bacterium]
MELLFNDEEQTLVEAVREYVARDVAPWAADRDESGSFPTEELLTAAAMGFMGLAVPDDLGGSSLSAASTAIVYEEIARASASVAVILSVHNSLTCNAINQYGTLEIKERLLPRLASGELIGAYCLTEPQAGSDAGAIRTRAVRDGDSWRISGQKAFITSGAHAGVYIVFAVTDPEARTSRRITAFVVERDTPGIEVAPKEKKLGLLASEINGIVFDSVVVPDRQILGEVGGGFGVAMSLLATGRIGIAAQATGIAQAALDAGLAYAKERQQFGQPIAQFQAIQWKLADMATEIDAARLLVRQAALMKDAGRDYIRQASEAKLFASEVASRAAGNAIQIHGGYGYIRDFGVERLYRDAKATELYEGTSEIQRLVIARHLLGQ